MILKMIKQNDGASCIINLVRNIAIASFSAVQYGKTTEIRRAKTTTTTTAKRRELARSIWAQTMGWMFVFGSLWTRRTTDCR
jgi:hypothetical protein